MLQLFFMDIYPTHDPPKLSTHPKELHRRQLNVLIEQKWLPPIK